MTENETAAALIARTLRSLGVLSATSAKNMGVAPGGSIITKSVTKD